MRAILLSMHTFITQLQSVFEGDIVVDETTLSQYSRDYSIFEVMPQVVVFPKHVEDIKHLVRLVSAAKTTHPDISITVRAAGTDMSGGPLNTSIIMDTTRYLTGVVSIDPDQRQATVLPGTFYRDFERATLQHNLIMPCFPASKDICAVGGMVANNGAGEKSLQYGQNKDFVQRLKVVLYDGDEYEVRPLLPFERDVMMQGEGALAHIARDIWKLIQENETAIAAGKPVTSKNASGYLIWDVWNPETGIFDLTKLFVGAQGTTGIITEITYTLVPVETKSSLLVSFVRDINELPELVNRISPFHPETLELYDDNTFKFAVKFFPDFLKQKGLLQAIKFTIQFIPEFCMALTSGIPKFIVLSEFTGNDQALLNKTAQQAKESLRGLKMKTRMITNPVEREKYFAIRHESFKLLSDHSKDLRTAAFIDDVAVNPEYLPQYLPELIKLLDSYQLLYTIAGHVGNGNLHVIPLMDFTDPKTKEIIMELSPKVYELALQYKGSITAEHNDGIVRTPYVAQMFGNTMVTIFEAIKTLHDPLDIFNPKKKVRGTIADMEQSIRIDPYQVKK